ESAHQLKLRARRLGLTGRGLYLFMETSLDEGLRAAEALQPALLVVDSIQTVYSPRLPNPPGSVVQLRECTAMLMQWAKSHNVPTILVGHVTKDGEIAGPRLLEHLVDVVLYLEGERFSSYRLLRGVKNRFGAISEIGVFEMGGRGLEPVENPSEIFLAERADGAIGSVIAPTVEGSRPLLVEIQALTSPSPMAMPRRTAQGLELSRLLLLIAVLGKRVGLALGNQDVLLNVVGGLRVQEPAVDLAAALAIVSSFKDQRLPGDLVALGEVGLSGELRSCSHLERRLAEASKLGFRSCVLPRSSLRKLRPSTDLELLPAESLVEAIHLAFSVGEPRTVIPSH
ncbi:MAG: DNA repair protein RadA, partial [Dehalococcoidia bacterium]